MPRKLEVVVIGCGSAGALAGRDSARAGLETLILEEHSRPGKFGACSGLVSKRGLDLLKADFDDAGVAVNEVRGARLHSKNGGELVVERRSPVACVLDRQRFDEALARQARDAGAQIKLKSRVTAVKQSVEKQGGGKQNGAGVAVYCGQKKFGSEFVIGADGAASALAASLDFPKIPKFVLGYEAEFEGCRVDDSSFVDLFFDSRAFPGFFAWMIPAGGKKVRVGFATRDSKSFALSKNALFCLPAVEGSVKTGSARKTREYAHVIPLAVRSKTQLGRVLLVGDAAGQVKASTGGGIVFGGLCARAAAESVRRAIDSNGQPGQIDYERAWRSRYGGTLALHSALRWKLNFLGDAGIKALIGLGRRAGLAWFLREFGDMDFVLSAQ